MAPKLGDPPAARRRAHRLSAQADDHQRTADRIDDDPAQP